MVAFSVTSLLHWSLSPYFSQSLILISCVHVKSFPFISRFSEEGDFLDLGAGDEDDELGLNEGMEAINPVKVPIRTGTATPIEPEAVMDQADAASDVPTEDFERPEDRDSTLDESNPEETEDGNDDEDDDEDETKSQRSRFHSERNPISVSSNSGNKSMSMGKPQPIRSLGEYAYLLQ